MKKIVVSIGNGLLAEAITRALGNCGEFRPFRAKVGRDANVVSDCEMMSADMLLAEVSYAEGTTIGTCLMKAREVRQKLPDCKIVFLCDKNSAPDIARDVMQAKKDGLIDNFFYSSVTEKYLIAALTSL